MAELCITWLQHHLMAQLRTLTPRLAKIFIWSGLFPMICQMSKREPNRVALDAAIPPCLHLRRQLRGASERGVRMEK